MARSRITSERLRGRLGRAARNLDGVVGVVMNAIAVVSTFDLNKVYVLRQLADAEALGINAAYDSTNKVLVYHHLERIFGRNPGAEVHFMGVAQSVTLTDMADITNSYAKKVSSDSQGRVKLLALIRNPDGAYTPTLTGGLDNDVNTAIPKAQELIESEADEFRLVSNVVIEGRSFNGTASSAGDLRALAAEGVSVVIAADNDISTAEAEYAGYAAVGDFVGMLTKAAISQNVGELAPEFNLENTARGWFVNPGLSSANKLTTYTDADFTTLDEKGFIFAEGVPNFSGIYFNDSHTCTPEDGDYGYIENNRVVDKMIALARAAVLPRVKSRMLANEETGFMQDVVRAGLEDTAISALLPMVTDGDLSGGLDAYIDPETNLISGDPIVLEITGVPVPIGREITIKVGFDNPITR